MTATMDKKSPTMNIDLRSPALNWISGAWVDSAQHTASINPVTGEVIPWASTHKDGAWVWSKPPLSHQIRIFD